MFIDPASLPDVLQAALVEQSGLTRDKALAVARLYESLRAEAPTARDAYTRIVQVEDEAGLAIRDRIATVVDTAIAFIREFSAVGVDTIDGYRQFEATFRAYLMAQVGRLAFPLLRALEVNAIGSARIEARRFSIDVEGAHMEASAPDPIEQRTTRAIWVLNAIRAVEYRGLTEADRARVDAIGNLTEDALTDEIALELEALLVKSTPDYELWSTPEGRDRITAYCLNRIVDEANRLAGIDWPGLDVQDIEFLRQWQKTDVISPDEIATGMRLLAKASRAVHEAV